MLQASELAHGLDRPRGNYAFYCHRNHTPRVAVAPLQHGLETSAALDHVKTLKRCLPLSARVKAAFPTFRPRG